jgi:hypothetical protein
MSNLKINELELESIEKIDRDLNTIIGGLTIYNPDGNYRPSKDFDFQYCVDPNNPNIARLCGPSWLIPPRFRPRKVIG